MHTLSDIIHNLYREELNSGLIKLQDDGQGVYIKEWNLDIPKPTKTQINAWLNDTTLQNKLLFDKIVQQLDNYINKVAKERGYDDAKSIATYVGCNNSLWDSEAKAFRDWKVSVWEYAIAQQNADPLPTQQNFWDNLPKIIWPEV